MREWPCENDTRYPERFTWDLIAKGEQGRIEWLGQKSVKRPFTRLAEAVTALPLRRYIYTDTTKDGKHGWCQMLELTGALASYPQTPFTRLGVIRSLKTSEIREIRFLQAMWKSSQHVCFLED